MAWLFRRPDQPVLVLIVALSQPIDIYARETKDCLPLAARDSMALELRRVCGLWLLLCYGQAIHAEKHTHCMLRVFSAAFYDSNGVIKLN